VRQAMDPTWVPGFCSPRYPQKDPWESGGAPSRGERDGFYTWGADRPADPRIRFSPLKVSRGCRLISGPKRAEAGTRRLTTGHRSDTRFGRPDIGPSLLRVRPPSINEPCLSDAAPKQAESANTVWHSLAVSFRRRPLVSHRLPSMRFLSPSSRDDASVVQFLELESTRFRVSEL
jgi:hypothetical protein